MAAAFVVLGRSQRDLFLVGKARVADVDVQLAGPAHALLGVALGDGSNCRCSLGEYDNIVDLDLFDNLEWDFLANLGVGRGDRLR